jgi:hypothetical protein
VSRARLFGKRRVLEQPEGRRRGKRASQPDDVKSTDDGWVCLYGIKPNTRYLARRQAGDEHAGRQ